MDLSNDETELDKDYSNSNKILKSSHNSRTKNDMVSGKLFHNYKIY